MRQAALFDFCHGDRMPWPFEEIIGVLTAHPAGLTTAAIARRLPPDPSAPTPKPKRKNARPPKPSKITLGPGAFEALVMGDVVSRDEHGRWRLVSEAERDRTFGWLGLEALPGAAS